MVGDMIRKYRKAKGYSQEQLARKLGITQGAVSQWESGKTMPEGAYVQALSVALDVPVGVLFEDQPLQEKAPSPEETGLNFAILTLLESRPDLQQSVLDFLELPPEQRLRVVGYLEAQKEARKA